MADMEAELARLKEKLSSQGAENSYAKAELQRVRGQLCAWVDGSAASEVCGMGIRQEG